MKTLALLFAATAALSAESPSVSLALGETNQANGIEQILPADTPWDAELKVSR